MTKANKKPMAEFQAAEQVCTNCGDTLKIGEVQVNPKTGNRWCDFCVAEKISGGAPLQGKKT